MSNAWFIKACEENLKNIRESVTYDNMIILDTMYGFECGAISTAYHFGHLSPEQRADLQGRLDAAYNQRKQEVRRSERDE